MMKNLYLLVVFCVAALFSKAQWNANTDENQLVSVYGSAKSVTVGTNTGKTYIAYYSFFERSYFMRAQLLDKSGARLLADTGALVTTRKVDAASLKYSIHASVDSTENLVVAYQYLQEGSEKVILMKINRNGKNFWREGHNGLVLGTGYNPTTAILPNQDIVVAWHNGTGISYQIVDAVTGALQWESPKTINPSTNKYLQPQVNSFADNTFSIVYQSNYDGGASTHLFAQRFDTLGNQIWSAPVEVSNKNTDSSGYCSISTDGRNLFVGYTAQTDAGHRAYLQKVNADGTLPWTVEGIAFAPGLSNDQRRITLSPVVYELQFNAIWAVCDITDAADANSGIGIQKFNLKSGARTLGDAAKMVVPMSAANNKHAEVVSICAGSNPIFTYHNDNDSVYATSVDTRGNFVWSPASTAIGTSGFAKSNFGFTDANRKFAVAVWSENRDTVNHVYAQNINCDGTTGEVLPVSIVKFWGTVNNNSIDLSWETATEINNRGFHVERSADGNNFTPIGYVASKAVNGNNTGILSYGLTDNKPLNGNNYYRLKQEDLDGKYSYSNIILMPINIIYSSKINKVYPNPVKNVLNIYIESDKEDNGTILITNMNGRIVKQLPVSLISGSKNIQINVSDIPAGNYFFQFLSKNKFENSKQLFLKY